MRIRQVKPSFFKDARIAEMPAAVRLTYIGLWMLADDAGYYRWDMSEAALELYGYDSRSKRERDITKHLAALVLSGRVDDLGCGHIFIPHLTDHQRLSGPTRRVTTYQQQHARECPHIPATPRTERNGTGTESGTGTERSGTVHALTRDEGETEFQRLVGLPAALGGKVQ